MAAAAAPTVDMPVICRFEFGVPPISQQNSARPNCLPIGRSGILHLRMWCSFSVVGGTIRLGISVGWGGVVGLICAATSANGPPRCLAGSRREARMACIEEPRRGGLPAWQDILWLVMTAAGLLLLIFIALAV
jgi:hypothetical protein